MRTLGIDRLSLEQQMQLAEELLEQLDARAPASRFTEAELAELDRRMAEHDADPASVVPWEKVEAQARTRLNT